MAAKLQAERFTREGPAVASLSDPICDTPMVVTLDQLRPYDFNPRTTRNPRYDDIKASILERKLDAPPPITRRPGEPYYIIRNGGNTRLQILNELWLETRDEAFFRICCLFRPWTSDGEIIALTGHLAENELRGNLTFIERALGVDKVREYIQKDSGKPLTQMELARRLVAFGYPITQSHISRLQDTVRYLLPAIPAVLFAGLGKPQVERLIALRKAAARSWERHAKNKQLPLDFSAFFAETLASFDAEGEAFSPQRVQDEIIGQMARLLAINYDALALEMIDPQFRHVAVVEIEAIPASNERPDAFVGHAKTPAVFDRGDEARPAALEPASSRLSSSPSRLTGTAPEHELTRTMPTAPHGEVGELDAQWDDRFRGHIVSPAETSERLQSIQRTIAAATGDPLEDFQGNVLRAIPVQAGGLHPVSDVWYIEPALDVPERLRIVISQLAAEIADEGQVAGCIEPIEGGIGFVCVGRETSTANTPPPILSRAVLSLLSALSAGYAPGRRSAVDAVRLVDDIAPLLQGQIASRRLAPNATRLTDAGLVKLFRLIRLSRRLVELESIARQSADLSPGA